VTQVQLNLLDSHDTARAPWILSDDIAALRLCVLLQMTLPGAPCIYYGDEVGLSAGDDPYCRGAFPWDKEASWDQELLTFYRQATALRHQRPVLRTGTFQSLYAKGQVYAFRRTLKGQEAVAVFNSGSGSASATIPLNGNSNDLQPVWPHGQNRACSISNNQLEVTVPKQSAVVLITP
jgi:neopullulanase